MRLASSRAADTIVQVAVSADHWFDLSPFAAEIRPRSLSIQSRDRLRAAIEAGQLREAGTPCLRPGDAVELKIDGLGWQRQTFKAARHG